MSNSAVALADGASAPVRRRNASRAGQIEELRNQTARSPLRFQDSAGGAEMLSYPVRLIPTEAGTVRALFPDVPEAVAEGPDEAKAMELAQPVLEEALQRCFQEHRVIPRPSDICGAPTVTTEMFIIQQTEADWPSPLSGGRY